MENKDIIVFASVDDAVVKSIEELGKQQGKHLVRLDDKVIADYLKGTEKSENGGEKTVDAFLKNSKNKEEAEMKAVELYNLITHNGDILKANEKVFKKSDITRKTNLTHKTLGELLTLFSLFGLIEYKRGDYEFSFVFSDEIRKSSALADITNTTTMLNQNIIRYISQFSDEEKQNKLSEIRKEISKAILK